MLRLVFGMVAKSKRAFLISADEMPAAVSWQNMYNILFAPNLPKLEVG